MLVSGLAEALVLHGAGMCEQHEHMPEATLVELAVHLAGDLLDEGGSEEQAAAPVAEAGGGDVHGRQDHPAVEALGDGRADRVAAQRITPGAQVRPVPLQRTARHQSQRQVLDSSIEIVGCHQDPVK